MNRYAAATSFFLLLSLSLCSSLFGQQKIYTRADTLRGSMTEERSWWDVTHYAIEIRPDYEARHLSGMVTIRFRVLRPGNTLQIDLQRPMRIAKIFWQDRELPFTQEGNAWLVQFPEPLSEGSDEAIRIAFEGHPVIARNAPWDGGWIFTRDKQGRPWMTVACQGLGASAWYPCKDHQSDEPDSALLHITVPDTLRAIANGRLRSITAEPGRKATYTWAVVTPINTYNLIPYIGKYVDWKEVYPGEKGGLDCSYYVLDYNRDAAKKQFLQVPDMLRCFEHWFGPYPFYPDGYKLVESPHLGMEHQSAIAYGNGYTNGYRGTDLSKSGWGEKWDFIIVHESGHEWFGNNITAKDIADMWIHESFTHYSETLYTTCRFGKEAGNAYSRGTRKLVANDRPIVGDYDVHAEGSGDMYYKGGSMIHYMRQLFQNDEQFRMALRGMNDRFRLQTVTYQDITGYWSEQAGRNLGPLFDQYLKTTNIPALRWKSKGKKILYRWTNCVDTFNIPVKVVINGQTARWIEPEKKSWRKLRSAEAVRELSIDPDCYATASRE